MNIRSRQKISINVLFVRASWLSLLFAFPCSVSVAQTITSSGLNTTVSGPIVSIPSGKIQLNITDGTRPGGGGNLFHSFGEFNVPTNTTANFLNNTGLPTSNILGRVTGGNLSSIYGTIQTTGFGNANLFLMNPAGFLFGANATLNVGGMVAFTSADYLRLADNARFNAVAGSADALLTAAPVAAFGFLGSNPGAITIQGSQLSVADQTGISLVGGDIIVQAGTLTAQSGQINLISVGRTSRTGGEVVVTGSGQELGFTPTGFRSLGTIALSEGSTIDASSGAGVSNFSVNDAGSVVIRGGQLLMDDSSIKAAINAVNQPWPVEGHARGIIEVTAEKVALSNHSTMDTTVASGPLLALPGRITVNVGTFSASDSRILAYGSTDTAGGAVTIQGLQGSGAFANSISLANTQVDTSSFAAFGANNDGGPILFRADTIGLNHSTLNASAGFLSGGPITLVSRGGLDIRNSSLLTTSNFALGGTVDLSAGTTIYLIGTMIRSSAELGPSGGSVSMAAPVIWLSGSTLEVGHGSNFFPGGTITLTGTKAVVLSNGTVLSADSCFVCAGHGSSILIHAGGLFTSQQSTISAGEGTIQVNAKKVGLLDTLLTTSTNVPDFQTSVGGSISVNSRMLATVNSQLLSTATDGQGGTIKITSPVLLRVGNVIDASSQAGVDGTVTINGIIQP
jgi:filamentous hemagglutinin family protein